MTAADLVAWRKAHGMTQLELAAALGVTPSTVHRWETGASIPPYLALALQTLARRRKATRPRAR